MSYIKAGRDAAANAYYTARGDDLRQDKILTDPYVVDAIANLLAQNTGSQVVYTPEMRHMIQATLKRRFETDIGNDIFVPPNYGVYEDPEMAAFYGVKTDETYNMQTRQETFEEQKDRLVMEVARELECEVAPMVMQMERYRREDWARHGVADEAPYIHADPDISLFRNEDRGWAAIDRPISTNDKGTTLNLYDATPEYTFPTAHPAWEIDREDGYFNSLPGP